MKRIYTLLLLLLATPGCDTKADACETDLDCYVGEQCVLQTCLPQDEGDADSPAEDAGDVGDTDDVGDVDAPRDTSDTEPPEDTGDTADGDADADDQPPHPVEISVGEDHSCARLSDHTVWCWGSNLGLALGQPSSVQSSDVPLKVEGLSGALQVVVGYRYTCARFEDGSVRCVGDDVAVAVDEGTRTDSAEPVTINLEDVHALSNATYHLCAIAGAERTLHCWGRNDQGQTGASADPTLLPYEVGVLSDLQIAAAGDAHTCVLSDQGDVRCIGGNNAAQRGYEGEASTSPNTVAGLDTDASVVELVSGNYHSCARLSNGRVRCWGNNAFGQLGREPNSPYTSAQPLEVDFPTELSGLAAGGDNTCGITPGGDAYCWGYNASGELGDGTDEERNGPVKVINLNNVTALALSPVHSCALTADHQIFCWGANYTGTLGTGDTFSTFAPDEPVVATWED